MNLVPDRFFLVGSLMFALAAPSAIAQSEPVDSLEVADSLASETATKDTISKDTVAKPPAPIVAQPVTVAPGLSLLPERPAADYMTFSDTPAAEVTLRFAREYRTSVILIGDGSTKIRGQVSKQKTQIEMLKGLFPSPEWSVVSHAGSFIIAPKPTLNFRPISFSAIHSTKTTD